MKGQQRARAGQHQRGKPSHSPLDAETLACRFHETYERLAPTFGYGTRPETAVPWDQIPDQHRRLMIAVCAELIAGLCGASVLGDGATSGQAVDQTHEDRA